jgi:arylsulfatase A-like enzyme
LIAMRAPSEIAGMGRSWLLAGVRSVRRALRSLGIASATAAGLALGASALTCAAPAQRAPQPQPNILLISIDALRADRLEAYGYERPTSPFLAELGRRGIVFENTSVNTHGTTPSHTTILSGLYQEQHGVGLVGEEGAAPSPFEQGEAGPSTVGARALARGAGGVVASRIPDDVALLPEILRAHGYATIGVTDGGNAGDAFGFARGFDRFDDRGGGIEKGARRVVRLLGEVDPEAPKFVFLHTYEVHSPYRPGEPQRTLLGVPQGMTAASSDYLLEHATAAASLPKDELDALSLLYDAEIRVVDDALRALFEELDATGFLRHAIVIVTSDHGEEFGEHGGLLHRDLLYDVLLRVPLIVVGPGIAPARRAEPVSSVDIAPTVLELVGIAKPAAMEGSSLLAERPRAAVIAQYGSTRYAIRTRQWKLIWSAPGSIELFDLGADPGERNNVAPERPDVAATLGAALDRWREQHRGSAKSGSPVELSADEWRELESLGYLR